MRGWSLFTLMKSFRPFGRVYILVWRGSPGTVSYVYFAAEANIGNMIARAPNRRNPFIDVYN